MPAERLRPRLKKPLQREKPALLLACFMDLAVGARHQALEKPPGLRLGGERCDAGQVGRRALVQLMELLRFLQRGPPVRLVFHHVEHLLELQPERPFVRYEFSQVDDHRSCLCLTPMYWETSSALMRSLSSSENRTPRRCRTFCN